MSFQAPDIDYAGLSPVIALTAGLCVVLLAGLIGRERQRWVVSGLAIVVLATAAGLLVWQWGEDKDLVEGAIRLDDLAIAISLMVVTAASFAVPLLLREPAAEERHGDILALLLCSTLGMVLLAQAQNLISLFVSLELLSVPLYVMCGSALRRASSLESGLKYLIVGSV